jgi:hypothetical protein
MFRILLGGLLLSACAAPMPSETGSPPDLGPVVGEDRANGFTLTLSAADDHVAAGEEIEVIATLGHDMARDVELSGSGSGVVFFSVRRVEDGLTSGLPVMTGDCARHVIPAGAPIEVAFVKSGGFSPDDPNADFLDLYFSDPVLTLPPGTWRIDASTVATLGEDCIGEAVELATSVEVVVED